MTREFAVLSGRPIEREVWLRHADALLPAGSAARVLAGGLTSLADPTQHQVLGVWGSRELVERREAEAELWRDLRGVRWWTDVVVPSSRPEPGLELLHRVADACDAIVIERN